MFDIQVHRSSKKTIEAIVVNLNDKTLRFNGKATVRLEKVLEKADKETNLFDCFNEYIEATMSTDRKNELFKLYEKAHAIVESGKFLDYNIEVSRLLPICNELFEFIDVPKYCAFIQYSRHLSIPPDLSVAASKGDYPEQTTITDVDYVALVNLAFVTRAAFPIIFSLLSRFDATMGPGHSELVCGDLIKNNPRINQLPGWHKLYTYVQFAFNKRGIPSQVDAVASNEYFTEKVLYNTIFSRLCCAVIPETEEGKNLATAINASVKKHESGGSKLNKKDFSEGDDEDKRSIYERYQVAESTKTANEEKQAEYFAFGLMDENDKERVRDRFKYQCMGLDIKQVELVEAVYDRLPPNWYFELHPHILKLLQLTYAFDVSPMVFWTFNYTQLMTAIVLGQVRLSEMGFQYLPSILGAIHNDDGLRSLSDGLKLNTEDKEYLTSICDIQSRNNEGRSFNEAILTATDFLDRLGNGIWQSNLEYGVLDDPHVYHRVAQGALFPLEIEVEIKNEFIALIRHNNS